MIEAKPLPLALPVEPVDGPAPTPRRRRALLGEKHPFFLRLLAGSLAVSIPVMLGLSIGLTYLSSQRIVEAASRTTGTEAAPAARRGTSGGGGGRGGLAQGARIAGENVDAPALAA